MRLLLWHCKELKYRDVKASNRPRGIHTTRPYKGKSDVKNVLLVFVCVEKRDAEAVMNNRSPVDEAVSEVLRSVDMLKPTNGVLLMPFAHLSSQLARPTLARQMLHEIAEALHQHVKRVEVGSFGFHKDFHLSYTAYGHAGSVEFREIPPEPHNGLT